MSVRVASLASLLALAVSSSAIAQTPEFQAQYGLSMIGAQVPFSLGFTGANVPVAVMDTGLQLDHPEFLGRIGPSFDMYTGGPVTGDSDAHGTHVSGIIAAARDGRGMMGVAPGARILPVHILAGGGISFAAMENLLPAGYRAAYGSGARIINNSWGVSVRTPEVSRADFAGDFPGLLQAYRDLVTGGAVQVWATGNDSFDQPGILTGLPYLFPELQRGWLAVTSVGRDGIVTQYANRCGVAMDYCLAAPGGGDDQARDGILSTVPGSTYARFSGTSMAAPHVSGALAIAQEMYPSAGAQQLAQLLLQTANDLGAPGIDPVYGWGLLSLSNLAATRDTRAGGSFSAMAAHRFGSVSQVTAAIGRQIGAGAVGAPLPSESAFAGPVAAYANLGASAGTVGLAADGTADGSVWVRGLWGHARLDGGPRGPGSTTDLSGVLAGVELAAMPALRIGVGVGATRSETDFATGGDAAEGDARHLFAYAALGRGAFFADVIGQVAGFDDTLTRRSIPGLGTTRAVVGRTDVSGTAVDARLRVGARFETAFAGLSPYVHASGSWQRTDAAAETGAGILSLTLPSQEHARAAFGPGLRVAFSPLALSETLRLAPELDVAYARRSGDLEPATAADLLGTRIVARANGVGRDALEVGARLRIEATDARLTGEIAYSGAFDEKAQSHTVTAGVGLRF
ncbi:S8 family peptidase [Salinarimonas rosea]|uniref:S8 family peptidase n=1 Tax=Salinarimonas rosea TaxID=552063 RepID=UPI00040766A1|nr:S8 family serine peptidase [Salinarimonas rosea]